MILRVMKEPTLLVAEGLGKLTVYPSSQVLGMFCAKCASKGGRPTHGGDKGLTDMGEGRY